MGVNVMIAEVIVSIVLLVAVLVHKFSKRVKSRKATSEKQKKTRIWIGWSFFVFRASGRYII